MMSVHGYSLASCKRKKKGKKPRCLSVTNWLKIMVYPYNIIPGNSKDIVTLPIYGYRMTASVYQVKQTN